MDKSVTPEDFKTRLCLLITSKKISTREFELRSGLASGTIGKIGKQGLTASAIKKITDTFPDVSADWLISGKEAPKMDAKVPGIPLLPFGALAGYLGGNNGLQSFTGETVYFPDFSGADYAIRVEGDSMLPRYNNGDVLAIRVLNEPTFFQWGEGICRLHHPGLHRQAPVPGPFRPGRDHLPLGELGAVPGLQDNQVGRACHSDRRGARRSRIASYG